MSPQRLRTMLTHTITTPVEPRATRAVAALAALLSLAACSDGSDPLPASDPNLPRIVGSVSDASNGQPVRGATVSTSPPTEEVVTGIDGSFVLVDASGQGGEYAVAVRRQGYVPDQRRTVASPGAPGRVDFVLDPIPGITTSRSVVQFDRTAARESLRLSSDVPGTNFAVQVDRPWVSVEPASGTLEPGRATFIAVLIDRDALPPGEVLSAEVLFNTDIGTAPLVVAVSVEAGEAQGEDPVPPDVNVNQLDCRRPDVLRTGLDDPNLPLVQFASTIELPGGATTKLFLVPAENPFLVHAVRATELGTLSIRHIADGPERTSLELFDLDLRTRVRTLAVGVGGAGRSGRAALEYAVEPGVYCYYLGGTDANFDGASSTPLTVRFDFEPAG